jgi:3'(2'), 5'-bisphosphate nucleotidase
MLQTVIAIAIEASDIIMKYYGTGVAVSQKTGPHDLVTQADREADTFIRMRLQAAFPDTSILSEESDEQVASYTAKVWMVDPLDGTKDFVNNGRGFSVMIGLCEGGVPTLGVVYNPTTRILYYAKKGEGTHRRFDGRTERLCTSVVTHIHDARMITRIARGESRALDGTLDKLDVKERIEESSVGLKLGMIAAGEAEFTIATSTNTSKWDTCAAQIILEEAGGIITDLKGRLLDYTQESLRWHDLFVASSNSELHKNILRILQEQLE